MPYSRLPLQSAFSEGILVLRFFKDFHRNIIIHKAYKELLGIILRLRCLAVKISLRFSLTLLDLRPHQHFLIASISLGVLANAIPRL